MNSRLEPVGHDPFNPTAEMPSDVRKLLAVPEIMAAIHRPYVVNTRYCVPWGAGRSDDDRLTYIDQHVPEFDPQFTIAGGKNGSLWGYVDIHEKTEWAAMEKLGMRYAHAHEAVAIPLERYAVETDGGDWKAYQKVWDDLLKHTESEHLDQTPPNMYLGPYPHAEADKIIRAEHRPDALKPSERVQKVDAGRA